MEFKDHFSTQSEIYAKSRPTYPNELFRFLASLTQVHELAWDCATGNGQAAVPLATYYKEVIATDASKQQMERVTPHERINYYVALGDNSGIESSSVDLVTIASALHWMDFDKFYNEVNRVLKPGGVFAGWAYSDSHISDELDSIVYHLSGKTLAEYWPPERAHVFNHYRDIPFPFKAIEVPEFKIVLIANFDFLYGYLNSWSSTQRYIETMGKNPVDMIKKELEEAWGDKTQTKEITWDMTLRVGRKE